MFIQNVFGRRAAGPFLKIKTRRVKQNFIKRVVTSSWYNDKSIKEHLIVTHILAERMNNAMSRV